MSDRFDRILVIFNPNSTGDAADQAEQLRAELTRRLPRTSVVTSPTGYAGHARELAREAAGSPRTLVVSVSGDGGYNEVVDGVTQAGDTGTVCAVMAAGNANDHRRVTRERPLADAIVAGEVRHLDLLRLTVGEGPDAVVRYAHSYIGVGLTPIVAIDLEKGGKGSLREIVSVVRTFARFRPFTITLEDGTRTSFDSLLFANIPQMAKYATLSDTDVPDDGRFEVIALPHVSKWRILGVAIRAATRGLGPQPTATRYRFTTGKPSPLQLDGEVLAVDAHTPVLVEIAPGALATVG
ncbi:MAG: diacylglycerol kinase [Pseudonocardia sp.]|mgnify:CR=1 FL=1|uniref:diacylglycerol/lipid kinase family protein n=1 Tax=unclassified Pseudonocardia TaxID=2619320 RepID=UPI00086913EA|nr:MULTISPECIES: diacylglycerol kinase family protein [unclassified Pseudonocardia]MBN9110863.1 diacylglycerol kinase [Pseudonocardia sp.]ODU26840.1 MAG: diacylglycerol kinase [Pseudonocardia sp. SCN 72-51]ODV05438.1 MAG: diacylglycerol kinase [Pseudonocardia sp. SCN 73-27]